MAGQATGLGRMAVDFIPTMMLLVAKSAWCCLMGSGLPGNSTPLVESSPPRTRTVGCQGIAMTLPGAALKLSTHWAGSDTILTTLPGE